MPVGVKNLLSFSHTGCLSGHVGSQAEPTWPVCVYTLTCQACPIDTLEHLQSSSVLLSCGLNQHWKKQSSHTAELPVFTYLFVTRLQ